MLWETGTKTQGTQEEKQIYLSRRDLGSLSNDESDAKDCGWKKMDFIYFTFEFVNRPVSGTVQYTEWSETLLRLKV